VPVFGSRTARTRRVHERAVVFIHDRVEPRLQRVVSAAAGHEVNRAIGRQLRFRSSLEQRQDQLVLVGAVAVDRALLKLANSAMSSTLVAWKLRSVNNRSARPRGAPRPLTRFNRGYVGPVDI
jgi:hypothetical protein